MTLNLVESSFIKVHSFYKKWGEADPFDKTAISISVLFGFAVNFIVASLFYLTQFEVLGFGLFPVGLFLLLFVLISILWFYKRKQHFSSLIERAENQPLRLNKLSLLFLFLLWALGMTAPIIYKLGNML